MVDNVCKNCIHRIKMESGKGFAMYCDVHGSTRTKNGHLRVKCNQPSCSRYIYTSVRNETKPTNQLELFYD